MPRRFASSDFLALERFQLAMLDAYLIPRSRDERPITALRVVPSVLAISAALRQSAHSCSRRLSRAGVQNDDLLAAQDLDAGGVSAVFGGSDARDGDGPADDPEFDFHGKVGEYWKGGVPSRFENYNHWRSRPPIPYIWRPWQFPRPG